MNQEARSSLFSPVRDFWVARKKRREDRKRAEQEAEQEIQKREALALKAIMLGVLADRRRLKREIGDDTLEVRVADAQPSTTPVFEKIQIALEIEKIIKAKTSVAINKNTANNWLNRALNLYEIFHDSDMVTLLVGGVDVPLNDDAIKEAWREEGLEEISAYRKFSDFKASYIDMASYSLQITPLHPPPTPK